MRTIVPQRSANLQICRPQHRPPGFYDSGHTDRGSSPPSPVVEGVGRVSHGDGGLHTQNIIIGINMTIVQNEMLIHTVLSHAARFHPPETHLRPTSRRTLIRCRVTES